MSVTSTNMWASAFTVPELARYWHKRRSVIVSMIRRGELRAFRVGNSVRISTEAVRAYEEQHQVVQPPKRRRAERRPADWHDFYARQDSREVK